MTQKLKVLAIKNNTPWASFQSKLQELEQKVSVEFDTIDTSFTNLPTVDINSAGLIAGGIVDPAWIRANILPLGLNKYDAVLLTVPNMEWSGGHPNDSGLIIGGYTYEYEIPEMPISIVHADEDQTLFNNPSYNAWYEFTQHEFFGHCFCQLTHRNPDDSHAVEKTNRLDSSQALSRYDWSTYSFPLIPLTTEETQQKNQVLSQIEQTLEKVPPLLQEEIDHVQLVNALIQVESGGNDNAYNPNDITGPAYGCFQIHQAYLDDVNKAQGTNITLNQLLGNRDLSIQVFNCYMGLYATPERIGREVTNEDRARIHNGGPNGWQEDSTIPYWDKVSKLLT